MRRRKLDKDAVKLYHKGLKELIDADARFDLKLKAIKSATETDPVMKKLAPDFRFVLQDAEEALQSSADAAREDMETTHDEKGKEIEARIPDSLPCFARNFTKMTSNSPPDF